jgi:divalent metal cation (Fe/Co/Zn/Cd) transporter
LKSSTVETRAGRRLEYFTLGWNAIEAAVAITARILAGSIALIGFGADSCIESFSGGILLWRLQLHQSQRREELARKLVGVSFLVLGLYVAGDSIWSPVTQEEPETSFVGIGLSIASLIIMPLLARAKRRVARRLESRALEADSRQTDLCAWLSAILVGGLLISALFGWWWADAIAALLMAPIIFWEGVETFEGDKSDSVCLNDRP